MIVRIKIVWLTIFSIILAPIVAALFLEIVSLLFRPISLSFRAYGNLYAAYPGLVGWIAPLPSSPVLLIAGGILVATTIALVAAFRFRS
jgi:F0F1-type ATP synthase membrane subunit a